MNNETNHMWGGRFDDGPNALMEAINASIDVDRHVYMQDIAGSLAHVSMLGDTGIITQDEAAQIREGLHRIKDEIARGEMQWDPALEDIHMHIEARLKTMIGDVAGKLHTARSRNDQVATDLRLYVMEQCDVVTALMAELQGALLDQAQRHAQTIIPGCTHLQSAQPVTFGHHMMAYVEMMQRDKTRFYDARARMAESPLGAAALAGTSFPIDREHTSHALGFKRPMRNSLDAVASRDFALEFLSASAICGSHLSRLAEELIIWSSSLTHCVALPESFTSGSSIMPQKRNPDAAELVRAKTGRLNGNVLQLLTVIKGTPLAYNKDLQEDKEPVFDSAQALQLCLKAMTGMIEGIIIHEDVMHRAASGGFSTATDLADWLVRVLHMPFRDAHHVTGQLVKLAETQHCALHALSLEMMQSIEPRITDDVFTVLSVEHSVASRMSFGGTAPRRVREAIMQARKDYAL